MSLVLGSKNLRSNFLISHNVNDNLAKKVMQLLIKMSNSGILVDQKRKIFSEPALPPLFFKKIMGRSDKI